MTAFKIWMRQIGEDFNAVLHKIARRLIRKAVEIVFTDLDLVRYFNDPTASAAFEKEHLMNVILAHGVTAIRPLLQASRTIPIVFPIAGDPVGAGFVDSLARPGGNATGFMTLEYSFAGKWLELLKEIAPGVTRAAVLRDASQGSGTSQFAVIQAMGPSLGVEGRRKRADSLTDAGIDLREMLRALTLYPWLNTAEKHRIAARWALAHWTEYQAECWRRRERR